VDRRRHNEGHDNGCNMAVEAAGIGIRLAADAAIGQGKTVERES
jgi:hypothetical protein